MPHRRFDPLAEFSPAWTRAAFVAMAFALAGLILINFAVAVSFDWRIYTGSLWVLVAAVLGIVSRIVAVSRLHASLRNKWDGRCQSCGYDTRGNTTGVCPECGSRLAVSTGTRLRILLE